MSTPDDAILPFRLGRSNMRGRVVRLDATLQTILGQHRYPTPVSALVAEAVLLTALIGQAGEQVQGIYEADYRDFNRETYARGRAAFDETYAGFKRLLIGAWHRDAAARDAQAAAE